MKKYILFAGINGAGKSSFYNEDESEYGNDEFRKKNGIRINADEIQTKYNVDIIRARKIAVSMINECLAGEESFNQETTLSGLKELRRIEQAKANGFYVIMHYIGLDSKELAIERVALRVQNKGHNVPVEVIESRYEKSLKNLKKCINIVDEIKIYDNSGKCQRAIYYKKMEWNTLKHQICLSGQKKLLNNLFSNKHEFMLVFL